MRRGSISRFVTLVLLALMPAVVGVVVCEGLVRNHPNTYRYKHEWMLAHAGDVKTLVLGASQNYAGICPEMLDSAFNLANVSQHYEHDWALLKQYGDRLKSLKTIIISIDDCMPFEGPMEEQADEFRVTSYQLYMNYHKHSSLSKYGAEIFHYDIFRRKLDRVFAHNLSVDCDSLGQSQSFFTPKKFNLRQMHKSASLTLKNHACRDRSHILGNVHYLCEIARWCKTHDVRLVLTTPPLWEGYVAILDPWQQHMTIAIAQQLSRIFGLEYYNHMTDTRFQGTDFHDASHLSKQGAQKFTAILKTEIHSTQ